MKKVTLLFLFFFLAIAVSFAQENPRRNRTVNTETIGRIMRQTRNNTNTTDAGNAVVESVDEPVLDVASVNGETEFLGRNYLNVGYSLTDMQLPGMDPLNNYLGATLGIGHTFFLNNTPYAGFLHVGLDVTWLDLTYNSYRLKYVYSGEEESYEYHQGDIAMQVGPSATMRVAPNLNLHAYARYAPTFSCLYADDTFYSAYASYYVFGASLCYKRFGLGFDYRLGDCKYKSNASLSGEESFADEKTEFDGWRFHITYRF